MRMRLKVGGISFEANDNWVETTESGGPITITGGEKGVGALQLTLAFYEGGNMPDPSADRLLRMALDFGEEKGLGPAFDELAQGTPLRIGAASYNTEGDLVRVWYVSDGVNFGMITYVCAWEDRLVEISEVEHIVRTIRFEEAH